MCQSMLAASMRSSSSGLIAVLPSSSSSSYPVPSTITSFPSFSSPFSPFSPSSPFLSSSFSSPSFTAAAIDAPDQPLQRLIEENKAPSLQLFAAQRLSRQELLEQQQQWGTPLKVDMQHRLVSKGNEKKANLDDQKRLLKDNSCSDAQLMDLPEDVRAKEVATPCKAAFLSSPSTSWSPSSALTTTTRPAKEAASYSILSAAISPSTVLAALNRRMKDQQMSFSTSSPSS